MSEFLHGLGLQYFRGIGDNTQKLAPFKNFNFFIGSNNSGKSTVLNFVYRFLGNARSRKSFFDRRQEKKLEPIDFYRGAKTGAAKMFVGISKASFKRNCSDSFSHKQGWEGVAAQVEIICNALAERDVIWFSGPVEGEQGLSLDRQFTPEAWSGMMHESHWRKLFTLVTGATGGNLYGHWIPAVISGFEDAQEIHFPKVNLIPAIRQIGPKGGDFFEFTGVGLIDRLAEIQSPDHDKRDERRYFDKINAFFRSVTGKDAHIEIPHNREHVIVHMDNKVLPLLSLGTGIHEVIMIAAFCTLSDNEIICIEEPEIHLHPLLQRKLIRYLAGETTNQYFIATHSAAFIDTPGAAIFHVRNDGAQTEIRETVLPSERYSICKDLGYKASDIVQSNAVIWVEGPSDRIYLKHWIEACDKSLIEGIHYSIMFYGGRLLSHLGADADEINEFINLNSLNRNLAIVMDSDRQSSRAKINETKKRLAEEFAKGHGVAWITKGREIENYIAHEELQTAVQAVVGAAYEGPSAGGLFDHALYFRRKSDKKRRGSATGAPDNIERRVDKVAVARKVCEKRADLKVLDLEERVIQIVSLIRRANT